MCCEISSHPRYVPYPINVCETLLYATKIRMQTKHCIVHFVPVSQHTHTPFHKHAHTDSRLSERKKTKHIRLHYQAHKSQTQAPEIKVAQKCLSRIYSRTKSIREVAVMCTQTPISYPKPCLMNVSPDFLLRRAADGAFHWNDSLKACN